jgi:hypothetical protein
MSRISDVMRPGEQLKRELPEHERRKAEAERIAAIEERYLKRVLGGSIDDPSAHRRLWQLTDERTRPRRNNARRKPISSPAGNAADKGLKWGFCLPGSFETGERR